MEPTSSPFCHIVIPSPDLEKASLFYEQIFGWKTQPYIPGKNYWFFESGNVSGAFDGSRAPAAKSVVLVLRVGDLDATLARIVERGGRVIQPAGRIGKQVLGTTLTFSIRMGTRWGSIQTRHTNNNSHQKIKARPRPCLCAS